MSAFSRYVNQITTATKSLFNIRQTALANQNAFIARTAAGKTPQELQTQANRAAAARLISGTNLANPTSSVIKRTRPF